jgi:redox-sensitive bicupin YhaK (pirin superfamily)
MIKKISNASKTGNGPIKISYPGIIWGNKDTGIGTIGRIDQANIPSGNTIKMHPHINDEILSYFRSGIVKHTDSEGFSAELSPNKLMLMKAGEIFYHEESVNEQIEGLQIFIRPSKKDLKPTVVFWDLTEVYSIDQWRLIASPTSQTPLHFSSETWIYDFKAVDKIDFKLPEFPKSGLTAILYVFQGNAEINEKIKLEKGESIVFDDTKIQTIHVSQNTELVLFLTNEASTYYSEGMYSGNKIN